MKKPALAGFLMYGQIAKELLENSEKHQQQNNADGYTEKPGNEGHVDLL